MSGAAAVLGSVVAAALPQNIGLIASDSELDAVLTDDAGTQRAVLRGLIGQELVPMLDQLQDPKQYGFSTTRFATLQQDPALVDWRSPEVNTLPDSTPERMDHKLGRAGRFDIREAWRILEDYRNDPGHTWSFPKNREEAKKQYLELIALKAAFLRTTIALRAARMAAAPLAEALALYRREADLVAPLPRSHLDGHVAPLERGFEASLGERSPYVRGTMRSGLWSFPKQDFIRLTETAAWASAGTSTWGEFVKLDALVDWLMIVAGFDYLSRWVLRGVTPVVGEYRRALANFWVTIRVANGITTTYEEQAMRFDAQLANLSLREFGDRLVVVPDDSVLLVSEILGDALLFYRLAGKREVNGPYIEPPPLLLYLAHHTSDTRNFEDPRYDKFSWVLASAAVALVKRPAAPVYCTSAYAKLKTLGLPGKLGNPQDGIGTPEHALTATAIRDGLTATERAELGQFVLRAGLDDWRSFNKDKESIRANIAAYARISSYYEMVTAP